MTLFLIFTLIFFSTMGRPITDFDKCPLTDLPIKPIEDTRSCYEYSIKHESRTYTFRIGPFFKITESKLLERNKFIIKGLILNHKWPVPEDTLIKEEVLEDVLKEATYPKHPNEKLTNLLLELYNLQDYDGESFNIRDKTIVSVFRSKLFFKNQDEFYLYLNTLCENGYIDAIDASSADSKEIIGITFTYGGLNKIIELQESGISSNNCFIAMSFSSSEKNIRSAIKEVCELLGFNPLLVDEEHYDSDVTINDAIISLIKKSRFIIADFTKQKDGVYFEAGYAAGRGLPVIYTCSEEDFKESHFDTNHFPHIVYKNLDDLKKMLKNKIEAWIL